MSYSRWGSSVWYTYWCVTYSNKRDDQRFDICAVTSFTYGQLKKYLTDCLARTKELVESASEKEIDELREYMLSFMTDVESDHSLNEYVKVAECPESDLPLLLSLLKTSRGKRALEHRLKGESLDTMEYCDD